MAMIKSTENACEAYDSDPTVCVSMRFIMYGDVASSPVSYRDPTAMT